ncbi:DUF4340 domain-containing protein, partial [Candidatus Sumerlaeota bacterium]|nr:DUF4340 domain-containing protein [Candidatus Sumerlaeota bacterium]
MGIKRTILSGFALIALIAIYAADGSRRDAAEHKRLAATKLMNAEASQINHIVIKKLGGDIELAKEGDAWKLIRPIQAAADQETAQSLAELIAKQERIGAQKANPAEMEKMGLAKPAITLTAQASGPPITLMIGEDTPVQGEVYAQLADGEYFTVAAALRDQAARSLYDFRDKRLIHVEAKDATALAITLAGKTVEAVKRDGQWKLQKPIASDADNQKVDDLLGELQMTRPVEFITTATITLQQFGLEAP